MYDVSTAYKESMKNPLRNHSYMRVVLGIINLEAQNSAEVESLDVTEYSDPESIFTKNDIGNIYATYEQDFFKSDGSMFFLPRDSANYHKSGVVEADLFSQKTEIIINFTISDIRGLTMEFGENYPTKFSVVGSDGKSVEFENDSSHFETNVVFEGITSLKINISSMLVPNGRFRIYFIKMGLVMEYDNDWIISAESSSLLSPINESLPEVNFSVVLKNEDQRFNTDNPSSEINFLEPGQNLSVIYGYEVKDEQVEWMQLHTLYVSEWSANDSQATITSTDRLKLIEDNYYKGRYYDSGISLYNLAEDVLSDAGIPEKDYYLDPYLKDVVVYNPLPNVTHKEALQIIANAGRSVMDYDRYGKIRIYSTFIPDYTFSSNGTEYYSDLTNLSESKRKKHYASYSQDFWCAGESVLFIPKFGVQDTGYVSIQMSKSDGTFDQNPIITQVLEASYTCFGIKIGFFGAPPQHMVIKTYLEDSVVETIDIKEGISNVFDFSHEFLEFDKIQYEFIKTHPNNRILIDYITLGSETDYAIEYDDLFSTPTGTQLQKVKNLKVGRTIYSSGSQQQDLSSDTITYDGENKMYYFSEPSYNYSVSIEEGGGIATIVASGAYFVEINFTGIAVGNHVKFSIKGYKYNISASYHTITINNRGNDMTWSNPLISDSQHCKDVAEWLADYESAEIEYELDFRGEPAIDVGDTIFQENKYVENLKVVVEEHQMSFKTGGALSGALRTRRKERVARTENKLGKYRLL